MPHNIAVPLCRACALLGRPPILGYDGYALYNWKRFDASGPVALGNLDTLQNFVHLYDEHWFILVHVEIGAIGAQMLAAIERAARSPELPNAAEINRAHTWAQEYVHRWVDDPRGTGGTPYMVWLRQLIDETRLHKLPS